MAPHRIVLATGFALAIAGAALAALVGYDALFVEQPCQDGWAGCIVDGRVLTAAPVRDAAGRPMPADARIGWFDLQPLPALSPFPPLSGYTGRADRVAPGPVASAEPEEATAAPEAAPDAALPTATPGGRYAGDDPESTSRPPVRREAARDRGEVSDRPSASPPPSRYVEPAPSRYVEPAPSRYVEPAPSRYVEPAPTRYADPPPAAAREERVPEPAAAAEERVPEPAAAREERDPEPAAAREERVPEPAAAREERVPEPAAAPKPAPTGDGVADAGPAPAVVEMAQPVLDDSCDDLAPLEPQALVGQLREGQIACLEERLRAASTQTEKDKISRVLIVNAEARGDTREWERLVRRHLERIDRSDPDLCFKYALHLSKGGVSRAPGVIRWAEVALENKSRWTGSTYTDRVYSLLQLRAEAAARIWEQANRDLVNAAANREELKAREERARGRAKDYAREWLDFARASRRDTSRPMALCVSAAGSRKFCEDR